MFCIYWLLTNVCVMYQYLYPWWLQVNSLEIEIFRNKDVCMIVTTCKYRNSFWYVHYTLQLIYNFPHHQILKVNRMWNTSLFYFTLAGYIENMSGWSEIINDVFLINQRQPLVNKFKVVDLREWPSLLCMFISQKKHLYITLV